MDSLTLRADLPAELPVHAQDVTISRVDGWGETIAVVMAEGLEPAEVNRRALILAAAPELLAVVEAYLRATDHNSATGECDCDGDCDAAMELWIEAENHAIAATAKARGEASDVAAE